jgi:hypothetical protein
MVLETLEKEEEETSVARGCWLGEASLLPLNLHIFGWAGNSVFIPNF